jgi:hypothetical protein
MTVHPLQDKNMYELAKQDLITRVSKGEFANINTELDPSRTETIELYFPYGFTPKEKDSIEFGFSTKKMQFICIFTVVFPPRLESEPFVSFSVEGQRHMVVGVVGPLQ